VMQRFILSAPDELRFHKHPCLPRLYHRFPRLSRWFTVCGVVDILTAKRQAIKNAFRVRLTPLKRETGMPSSNDYDPRLSLRDSKRTHSQIIIGHHLILHGYGHWLPNDPRGSGSDELRQEKLADLGEIHKGRKRVQPSRDELREFSRNAKPRLDFTPLWFDAAKRQAIGDAIGELARKRPYTVWACAMLKNHAHVCIRRHRDDALEMWNRFAETTGDALRRMQDVPDDHPIWSHRPYKVFLSTPAEVRGRVQYLANNPAKEGLPPQDWLFVATYDDWPQRAS